MKFYFFTLRSPLHLMSIRKNLLIVLFSLYPFLGATSIKEEFQRVGYVEIYGTKHNAEAFDVLYSSFDELIAFLQKNPHWAHKLDNAKERFIRSKERDFYSTEFIGFYDESERNGRHQISFYYATHFHDYLCSHFPEFNHVPEIICFFEACFLIQESFENLLNNAAAALDIEKIFFSKEGESPILFKVVKYLPSYTAARPHYDGTVLSLFLDSTDNQSLLLSPYKTSLAKDDFVSPQREFSRGHSFLLIPGTLLSEFSIYPTPHIVKQSGKIRYAAIAFAMRPYYTPQKITFASLPNIRD